MILVTTGPIIFPVKLPNLILIFRKGKHIIIKPIEIKDQNESQTNPIMKRTLREIILTFLAPIKY